AVGEGRDLPRPDRGPRVAEDARVPEGGEEVRRRAGGRGARLRRGGLRQALRGQGARRGDGDGRGARRRASAEARGPRRVGRRRRRHPFQPAAGECLQGARRGGRECGGGALVAIIEAMKMENEITAHKAGTIKELPIKEGGSVSPGDTIAVIA